MAKKYTATITVRRWKEHTCVGCGGIYVYRIQRKAEREAGSAYAARAAAEFVATMEVEKEVDQQPCTTCGLYQPDMLGQRRSGRHGLTFVVMAALLGNFTLLWAVNMLSPPIASALLAALCFAALVIHFAIDFPDPNANLEANRLLARRRQQTDTVRTVREGRPEPPEAGVVPRGRSIGLWPPMLALTLAVALLSLPEVVRLANGWPANPETSEFVVAPGDEVTVFLPQRVGSINGLWSARNASATATFAGGPPVRLVVVTPTKNWGETIWSKSRDEYIATRICVVARLPKGAEYAGNTAEVRIHLQTLSPKTVAPGEFKEFTESFDHDARLYLAAAGAGEQYRQLWHSGLPAGLVLAATGSLALIFRARGVKGRAPPTQMYADN